MKQIISKTTVMLAIAVTMASFTNLGGEGFEISLNNKVVVQQFGKPAGINSLRLNRYSANDQLKIKYYHCGHIAKNRTVSIKDGKNKVLKEWHFADAATPVAAMLCDVKDILNLSKGNVGVLRLYYASSELPDGRLLTNIIVENNSVASNN